MKVKNKNLGSLRNQFILSQFSLSAASSVASTLTLRICSGRCVVMSAMGVPNCSARACFVGSILSALYVSEPI